MNTKSIEPKIHEVLFRCFGLEGELIRLGGENLNYRLTTPPGDNYVFKVVTGDSSPESAEMENELLEHAKKAIFPVKLPVIIKNYSQQIETRIKLPVFGLCRSRLISFIEGKVLDKCSDISSKLLFNTGKTLAIFDKAIKDFDHPAAHYGHDWELVQAGRHRDKLETIDDLSLREQVAWAFDLWQEVQDDLPGLPHQVIHGDANRENILVEGDSVVGLVDFGDACYNPRICELAVSLAYLMTEQDDPMAAAASVIAGYVSEVELQEDELAVLFPLVCGRLAVTICMASSRMYVDPGNPNWFTSLEPAGHLLQQLHAIGFQ